ncbi:MAG: D-alanine--D-alanine ligase [Brockia lithotrophica]|nr:D-alanine--D-alanine ligase [Brockia lithotrophica]
MKLALLFGGRSAEHEVSLASARNVYRVLDRERYELIPVYIDRGGSWHPPERSFPLLEGEPPLPVETHRRPKVGCSALQEADVAFPLLHGPHGEDGTVQGYLTLLGIPYVGSGVAASAAGMDKVLMKRLFAAFGLPQVPYRDFTRRGWTKDPETIVLTLLEELGLPLFVKPANLGSSVGIRKVNRPADLPTAVEEALRYDRKVVVEAFVPAREIEVAVLGNEDPQASVPGEVVPHNEFYDYEAKYTPGKTDFLIPAPLDEALVERFRSLALRAFRALDARGFARVDFFLHRETGEIYVNEVNTIPGFTSQSMYPKLWEATGLSYSALIDRLVALALEESSGGAEERT